MHFTATQLFWECHENLANENHPSQLPKWVETHWSVDQTVLKRELRSFKQKLREGLETSADYSYGAKIYDVWRTFVRYYSTCAMTKEEDKLVALMGIADDFGQVLGDQLVAGLWKNHLLEEMCWRLHHYLPSMYVRRLPSRLQTRSKRIV
jgi:hypothetical protein